MMINFHPKLSLPAEDVIEKLLQVTVTFLLLHLAPHYIRFYFAKVIEHVYQHLVRSLQVQPADGNQRLLLVVGGCSTLP